MFETSSIEISQSALKKNVRFLKRHIGPDVVFSSVIKGNAYGHGIKLWVPLAESCGVRHFATFDAGEAYRAHQSRTTDSKIMIMGDVDNDDLRWAIENDISFYIFDVDRLETALKVAKQLKLHAHIHLELETGLHRTGLKNSDLRQALSMILRNNEYFVVEGVCTHLSGAESINNYYRIKNQLACFQEHIKILKRRKSFSFRYRHTACSAAALTYPETIMDMVRIGIAQYGFWPSKETWMNYQRMKEGSTTKRLKDPFRRVMRWKSRIMSIKTVDRGEFVGYGTSYQTSRKETLATVPVGYYHGFSRSLSNLGYVLVNGRRASVVGMVNMNMIMIDVTDIKTAKKGDEVILIGKQKNSQISVSSFSDLTRNLNYEVLTRLPSEIPRVVVE